MKKNTLENMTIDIIVYMIIAIIFICTIYPFYYALILSFNNGIDASTGGIFLWPRKFTFDNYRYVFSNEFLFHGFVVTITRTLIGTAAGVLFTSLFAFSLSHNELIFRRIYFSLVIFSMYFSGGIITYFVLLKYLGLIDTFAVYIVPNLMNIFNAIIMINFFREIPDSVKESAKIDGANDLVIFFKIIFPISTPVFATVALFTGVGHWNNWFDSAFFTTAKNLKTLAYWLVELINRAGLTPGKDVLSDTAAAFASKRTYTAETIRMAAMIVVIVPIICVYPFLQRYFVKGMMLGSIKG